MVKVYGKQQLKCKTTSKSPHMISQPTLTWGKPSGQSSAPEAHHNPCTPDKGLGLLFRLPPLEGVLAHWPCGLAPLQAARECTEHLCFRLTGSTTVQGRECVWSGLPPTLPLPGVSDTWASPTWMGDVVASPRRERATKHSDRGQGFADAAAECTTPCSSVHLTADMRVPGVAEEPAPVPFPSAS